MFRPHEFELPVFRVAREREQGWWDERVILSHVFQTPRERYYGTYTDGITARPVGMQLGNGCYRR